MQPLTTESKNRRVHGVLPLGMMQNFESSISCTYFFDFRPEKMNLRPSSPRESNSRWRNLFL